MIQPTPHVYINHCKSILYVCYDKKKNNSFKQAFPFIEAVIQEHMLDRKTEEEDEILDIDFLNVQEKPDKCHFEEQENSSDGKLSFAKKKIRIFFWK